MTTVFLSDLSVSASSSAKFFSCSFSIFEARCRVQGYGNRDRLNGTRLHVGDFNMLTIAGKTFTSRLILGTGKYKDFATMKACYEAAQVDMVTLAVRRFDLNAKGGDNILNWIPKGLALLPNTAGCCTGDEALRVARLARVALETDWVKLEVIGDPVSLYPDGEETLRAARVLVQEGFVVLPYVNADPILAKKLCEAGCAAVMPLGSAIGSGLGVQNPGRRRGAAEHRGGRGPGSGPHGPGHGAGRAGRTPGLRGGADAPALVRQRFQPPGRGGGPDLSYPGRSGDLHAPFQLPRRP
jgi:hypothetical protein